MHTLIALYFTYNFTKNHSSPTARCDMANYDKISKWQSCGMA